MFGNQLTSGVCGCGCSTPACIQARNINCYIAEAGLPSSASATDAENIRAWINNPANFPCGAWPTGSPGWQSGWGAAFDTISSTTPDLGTVSNGCAGAELSGGGNFAAGGFYAVVENGSGNATSEYAQMSRYLLSASTAYIAGIWCDGGVMYYQQSCVMTGTPVGGCYQYILPAPPSDLIAPSEESNVCAAAYYYLYPISDPGGYFGDTWSELASYCTGGGDDPPCAGSFSTSPGACLSGDPFFGDDP